MNHFLFSVGHSQHSSEEFLALLLAHGVNAVADVRSSPFSRFCPQFNRNTLERSLKANGVKYVFLGDALGGRPSDPSCYEAGRVSYRTVAQRRFFLDGLERLLKGVANYRIACMCSEKEPLECHRTLLIGEALRDRKVQMVHIHATGALETQEAALKRLVVSRPKRGRSHPAGTSLIDPTDAMIRSAVDSQAEKVAYFKQSA